MFNLVQDGSTSSFQTTFVITVSVLGPLRRAETVDDSCFICRGFVSEVRHREQELALTWALQRGYFICRNEKGENSQSVRTLACKPLFFALSIVFVNVGRCAIEGLEQTW